MFIDSLDQLWILLGLIFIRMGTGSIYFQTEMSLLPKLLNETDLKLANEIHSVIWSLSYALGMAVAGFYIHYFGIMGAFIADMVMYIIGFYLLYHKIFLRWLLLLRAVLKEMIYGGFLFTSKSILKSVILF